MSEEEAKKSFKGAFTKRATRSHRLAHSRYQHYRFFVYKMQSTPFCWLVNFLLALIIYYNAELGRVMGLKELPLAVSVIWPATGFSLAALLLFGYKTWPGILIGNFCFNFIHLYLNGDTFLAPFLTATIISIGSLIEALLGAYILRKYNTFYYFSSVKDIVIFLVPASLMTSFIASVIGTAALSLYAFSSLKSTLYTAITFWVGDSMGVYVFTPLLVIWSVLRPPSIKPYLKETILMGLSFVTIFLLAYVFNFEVTPLLFIPLCVWATYRFGMHGATLSIFLVALTTIVPTSLGYGFLVNQSTAQTLLNTIIFLEIVVATSLLFAALLNERNTLKSLQRRQITLDDSLEEKVKHEKLIKEKMTSLGLMATGMTRQLLSSLKSVETDLPAETDFDLIKQNLNNAQKIAKMLHEQGIMLARASLEFRSFDINSLINLSLAEVSTQHKKSDPDFSFTVFAEYDKNVRLTLLFPDDLVQVLILLFNFSINSMKEKKSLLRDQYKPILTIRTNHTNENVEIGIEDNGVGISENKLNSFFSTFMSFEEIPPEENQFSLIHDIIVYVYKGEIQVESREEEYFRISITIPK